MATTREGQNMRKIASALRRTAGNVARLIAGNGGAGNHTWYEFDFTG